MPLQQTSGNVTQDAYGGNVAAVPVYIEDVYSTFLYTGNGTTQTITNGIDLSGKGGLTWIKNRGAAQSHGLSDTARGAGNWMSSDLTVGNVANNNGGVSAFTSSGFSVNTSDQQVNGNGNTYASWAFRKQPKFFDVVTYTGNGVAGRTIAHNLGSTPGCIIVKATSAANDWLVYHTSLGNTQGMSISSTSAAATSTTYWNNTSPTSTQFTVGTSPRSNENGTTFVAYLFANNAGGFGLTGTDNVISCGSFTTDGSGTATVNLGYEPQFVIAKASSTTSAWLMNDNMRGFTVSEAKGLFANTSGAEGTYLGLNPTSTGFIDAGMFGASTTVIYIAIRRGPMKTPTSGTSVFKPTAYTGNGSTTIINAGFPIDLSMTRIRAAATGQTLVVDRLRGASQRLFTDSTTSESTSSTAVTSLTSNTSITFGANGDTNSSGQTYVTWDFQRAPGFFDEVCYTGTGTASQTLNHNLGVVPELVINKSRSTRGWTVFQGSTTTLSGFLQLNTTSGQGGDTLAVSSTTFTPTLGAGFGMNTSGENFVTYLFASCPGVSKVGRFTGTGATQTISCGFAARFVMIKRFNSTGDWWVWDTARGMVAGTDPRLALNSTAAETNANWVYTDASGFQIVTTDATVNASGGTYIYLCIA